MLQYGLARDDDDAAVAASAAASRPKGGDELR